MDFNPHSREGSDKMHIYTLFLVKDFNPHSREGSDLDYSYKYPKLYISIHTPAKGVTRFTIDWDDRFDISIHTPAKGVTSSRLPFLYALINFNPHSREGSDRNFT